MIVTVPVATAHVGFTTFMVGAVGGVGFSFAASEVYTRHVLSAVLLTLMVCAPAASV